MGSSFTIAAYLQYVRGYDAIQSRVIFSAATAGVLLSSLGQERFAKRHAQRTLIIVGFIVAVVGVIVLLALVNVSKSNWAFAPGLFVFGFGVGGMLTPSANIVQSSFPEERQGEISGLSRSVSNLGFSIGTAIAGTILAADLSNGGYAAAMIALAVIALGGLVAAVFVPRRATPAAASAAPPQPAAAGTT
jgi:MFS family permease